MALLLAVGAALCLVGCDSDSSSTPSAPVTAEPAVAACSLDTPPRSAASPMAASAPRRAHGRVGVLLSGSSASAPARNAALLAHALGVQGATADVQVDPRSDPGSVARDARRLLSRGAQVLVIDAADAAGEARAERRAARAGVPVIATGRLDLQGTAPYYVSFDAEDVGRLQARAMLDCLAQQGVQDPKVILLDGDTDADDNAVLRAKGAHEVLDPVTAAGDAQVVAEAAVTGADAGDPEQVFRRALQAAGGHVDAVVAGSDDIAAAAATVLGEQKAAGDVVVVGQGTRPIGVRRVVGSTSSATVFQDPRLQAEAIARLASALLAGKRPSDSGLSVVSLGGGDSGERRLRSVLLPGQVVTRADAGALVESGALTVDQLCRGLLIECAEQGLP